MSSNNIKYKNGSTKPKSPRRQMAEANKRALKGSVYNSRKYTAKGKKTK